jgi:capsular polysaccharide biosynthesis protein
MSLNDYLRILRRWWWIMLLLALLTALSAYAFSALQTPIYKSTVLISVKPSRPDFGLSQSTKALLRSYETRIRTEDFAAAVIDRLSLDVTPESLLGDVTIASDDSRFTIQIDVENVNGDVANDIARELAYEFLAWRNTENADIAREDQVRAEILQSPTRYSLFRPQKDVNTIAGAILGLILGGVIIFLVEYRDAAIIRFADDVERGLGLPVLGAIPTAGDAFGGRGRAARAR